MRSPAIFTLRCVIVSTLACLACNSAMAQDLGENARMAGTARSAAALVRGLDALGVNPELIARESTAHVSFTILPFGFHVGTDFINWGTYKKYFTGKVDANGR